MKSRFLLLIPAFIAASVFLCDAQRPAPRTTTCEFQADMRKLWEDHITWTRNVILNIMDNLPGTNEAVTRLLQNQADIGNSFAPFYGQAVADSVTALFTIHITTAADLLIAVKNGDSAAAAQASAAWYANGDDIVAYLVAINPRYDQAELDEMMDMHLELTVDEALARLNQDYAGDVAAYDAVHDEILEMSDFLAGGIIEQFRGSFRSCGNSNSQRMAANLSDGFFLEQNQPNPFTEITVISFSTPENTQEASMVFRDVTGRVIKSIRLNPGEGEITISAGQLSKGTYTYSLVVDGIVQGVKTMIH